MRFAAFPLIALIIASLCSGIAGAKVALQRDSTGHLLVPVLVNGEGPFPFMLDTGADESAVFGWFAAKQRLPQGHPAEISGATANAPEITTLLDRLSLDGRVIRHVDADTIPDRADGAKIAGIAGADLLMGRLALVDISCERMSLSPLDANPAHIMGSKAIVVQAGSIEGGKQLTLPVQLNGVAGVATLDTGARSTMINNTFAKIAGIDPNSETFQDGPPARGAVQTAVPSRMGPIGTLSFAGIVRHNVTARVVDLPVFDDAGYTNGHAMNIGVDLLGGVRLLIDYQARRVWMAPSRCAAIDRPLTN